MHIESIQFDIDQRTLWDQIVRNKSDSPIVEDRASIFLGIDMDTLAPVCFPRSTLDIGHYHVRGMTGSGKTTASLMSFIFQILRGYQLPNGERSQKCPVVILDMKGDQALFNATWDAAIQAGQTFRYFSTRKDEDYFFFDPFQMFRLGHLRPIHLATEFIRAFSLDYGLVYGGLYFTHENLQILNKAVEEMLSRPNPELTIRSLARILHRLAKSSEFRDARHIERCLDLLAAYPQLNIDTNTAPRHQFIDMARALEDCEVLYFFLQMEGEAPSLRQVSSLALYTLVEAAKQRCYRNLNYRDTYVVIDEFYHIAGKSFGDLLSTVRGWGIHMVLANQSMAQLKAHDENLPVALSTNISVEQTYTIPPDDEEYFKIAAGETTEILVSKNFNTRSYGETFSERNASFLVDSAIKQVNDTRLASLMMIGDGNPKAPGRRVLKVQGLFPTTAEEYGRFQATPFPQSQPEFSDTTEFADERKADVPPPAVARADISPELAALVERMAAKWMQLESEASPRTID